MSGRRRGIVESRRRAVATAVAPRTLFVGLLTGLLVVASSTGTAPHAQTPGTGVKQARATRVGDGAIRIDGTLDEPIWRTAPVVTDFLQAEPDEGARPTDRMEVRFAYDDSALYVGARMFSADPVQAPLSRRDDGGQAESIQIELDTYFDRRTAYMFGVTAAGVRLDHYHPRDSEGNRDTVDPVSGQNRHHEEGWTAELWLPFSQLRFNERDERVFGLNINHPGTQRGGLLGAYAGRRRGLASCVVAGCGAQGTAEVLPYLAGSSGHR